MTEQHFKALQKHVIELIIDGKMDEIKDMLNRTEDQFPEQRDKMSFWKACIFSSLGQYREALTELENALSEGYFWPPDVLKKAQDLAPLRESDTFKKIVDTCEQMMAVQCSGI